MGKKYNEEFALEQLRKYYNELGRIPKREEFQENNWKPFYDWYRRNFDSFENACCKAGLIEKILTKQEKSDISINQLKTFALKLQRIPYVKEFESLQHEGLGRRELEKFLDLKYNDICKIYIPQYKLNHKYKEFSKDDVIKELTKFKNILGRTPMEREINLDNLPFSLNVAFRVFNTEKYSKIIKELGWELIGRETIIRSEEELLNDFNMLYQKLNRVPYYREIDNEIDIASYKTYLKCFGSIENVCQRLNINYKINYKGSGAGKIIYDNNGNLCKSLIERDISNFFIKNNIYTDKESNYSDITGDKKDRRRFDWKIYINNTIFYCEYAGMYSNPPRGKIGLKYKNKIESKIKTIKDYNMNDRCIIILPIDLQTKTLKEIFVPYFKIDLLDADINDDTFNYYLSDDEIFERIMKYSEDENYLPFVDTFRKSENYLYTEIIRRYGNYTLFGERYGKYTNQRRNYWNKDTIYGKFVYMINKYGKILSSTELRKVKDDNFKGLADRIKGMGGYIDFKFDFYQYCIDKKILIPIEEINWLNKIINNKGYYYISKNELKQRQEEALYILNQLECV